MAQKCYLPSPGRERQLHNPCHGLILPAFPLGLVPGGKVQLWSSVLTFQKGFILWLKNMYISGMNVFLESQRGHRTAFSPDSATPLCQMLLPQWPVSL